MNVFITDRGFEHLRHPTPESVDEALVIQSSAIGNYPDACDRPGSSFLRFGSHHLNREEVVALVGRLNNWLITGSLKYGGEKASNE